MCISTRNGCKMWTCIFIVLVTFCQWLDSDEVSMTAYFPEFNRDPSGIKWVHAVNSKAQLENALKSDGVHMLEADVSLGYVIRGVPEANAVPVMAHPPANESDIDFREWLSTVVESGKRVGIKLDFKSIEIVQPSLQIIEELFDEITFPIWFNADILPGPVNVLRERVPTFLFLHMTKASFPESVLSLGWSVRDDDNVPPEERAYGWENVVEMAGILHSVGVTQPVTFPVWSRFVASSIDRLRWLLAVVPNSTLTVWSGTGDVVTVDDLLKVRAAIAIDRIYYDLPPALDEEFAKMKNSVVSTVTPAAAARPDSLCQEHGFLWSDVRESSCELKADPAVAFFKPCRSVVALPASTNNHTSVTFRGILEFLRTRSTVVSSQSLSLSFGKGEPDRKIVVEHCGKVHLADGTNNILNTSRIECSRCYGFQVTANDEAPDYVVTLWPIRCLQNDPQEPPAAAVITKMHRASADGRHGFLLSVESRGDAYKVVRNLRHVCASMEPADASPVPVPSGARLGSWSPGFFVIVIIVACTLYP